MLLNTFTYVCFLAVTACIHWMLPTRFRNGFLVAVSVAFLYFNSSPLIMPLCSPIISFTAVPRALNQDSFILEKCRNLGVGEVCPFMISLHLYT